MHQPVDRPLVRYFQAVTVAGLAFDREMHAGHARYDQTYPAALARFGGAVHAARRALVIELEEAETAAFVD